MLVSVNGVRLFVDVENAGLVPEGAGMREKPVLLLLHGGPGFDHSAFKPRFSGLSDVAQIVYVDQRGNGRSEDGDPAAWTLAQWGDDVKGLCDALGLVRPVVLGMSWGGYVAQAYATRHPDHPGKLVLASTVAKVDFPAIFKRFEELGGPQIARIAESYWTAPTAEKRAEYFRHCVPFYRRKPVDPDKLRRVLVRNDTALHFNGPGNEQGHMDFRSALGRVACPVLVMAGAHDPLVPPGVGEALVAARPRALRVLRGKRPRLVRRRAGARLRGLAGVHRGGITRQRQACPLDPFGKGHGHLPIRMGEWRAGRRSRTRIGGRGTGAERPAAGATRFCRVPSLDGGDDLGYSARIATGSRFGVG